MKKTKTVGSWRLTVVGCTVTSQFCALLLKEAMIWIFLFIAISAKSQQKQIGKLARNILFNNEAIATGHIGISIYDPAADKYLFNHNASHYFIPASNVKLFSLYAGMKYLGDSLVAARVEEGWDGVNIYGTGDPTFLHPDFTFQSLYNYIKSIKGRKVTLIQNEDYDHIGALMTYGKGWMLDDYNSNDMAERSFFPIYGNLCTFLFDSSNSLKVSPPYFKDYMRRDKTDSAFSTINREISGNIFDISGAKKNILTIPFKTQESYGVNKFETNIIANLLSDTLGYKITQATTGKQNKNLKPIYSQPSDSLFKPMMHRSDNFFAEQTVLMASNEYLGYMSDEKMIDTILNTTLKDMPQKPKWVDGSGLSRYNLFTPQSFVYILNKMKNEFGLQRMKNILPTGGKGTISNYYKDIAGFIYAKTGTLSNNCALSGYLITEKGKLLIFSVLVNNYITGATPVRRAVAQFLQLIRQKY